MKPEIYDDEVLADLELKTDLPLFRIFTGLWCFADREGRFEWAPRSLRGKIHPCWDGDFGAALEALASKSYIVRYTVDGKDYGYVRTFKTHQPIHPREPRSTLPGPSEHASQPFPGQSGTSRGESGGILESLEAHALVEAEVEVSKSGTRARSDATPLHRDHSLDTDSRHGKAPGRRFRGQAAPEGHGQTPARPGRVYTMPSEEPDPAYLDDAVIAGVSRERAAATWTHYWTVGLPERGVEKLHPFLVKSAKERATSITKVSGRRGDPDDRLQQQADRVEMLREQERQEEALGRGGLES